jgi:hypothetical protein
LLTHRINAQFELTAITELHPRVEQQQLYWIVNVCKSIDDISRLYVKTTNFTNGYAAARMLPTFSHTLTVSRHRTCPGMFKKVVVGQSLKQQQQQEEDDTVSIVTVR